MYGIMFLTKDFYEGDIKVDYSLTILVVCAEAFECLISKYSSTCFLLYSTLDYGTITVVYKTPSWVPD